MAHPSAAASGRKNLYHFMQLLFSSDILKILPANGIFLVKIALVGGLFLLLHSVPIPCQAEEIATAEIDDQQLAAFFQAMEESFRRRSVPAVMAKLHKKFSYIMTYCTDDSFSVVENNFDTYRTSVGSFFLAGPEIREFTIQVEQVERLDKEIAVVARIKSAVLLNGILNTCKISSNYSILQYNGGLLVKDIRGDATCSNKKVEEGQP